jgi:uncharacterized protein (DUF362 family)
VWSAGPRGEADRDSRRVYSEVAIAQGLDIAEVTREAIQAVGGMAGVANAGDQVCIKANWLDGLETEVVDYGPYRNVTAKALGMISHPTVLLTVAEACLNAGATQVTIGDTTMYGWHGLGIDEGPVSVADDLFVPVPSPNTDLSRRFVSRYLMEGTR